MVKIPKCGIVWLCGILPTLLLTEAFQQQLGLLRSSPMFKRSIMLWSDIEDSGVLEEVTDKDLEGTTKEALFEIVISNQPSQFAVMKELLGLNVFSLILALLIAFFMGANLLWGPGWLGNKIGIDGTGTFQDFSGILDLSQTDYLL